MTRLPCSHALNKLEINTATGDVWCFTCQPRRNLSAEYGRVSPQAFAKDAAALLREALDMFHGTHELCSIVDSPEWIWRWRVAYLLEQAEAAQ